MAKSSTTPPTVEAALRELLLPFLEAEKTGEGKNEAFASVKARYARLTKDKDTKAAFAPISALVKCVAGPSRECGAILQRCLELPSDQPLHQAAAAFAREWPHPVLVSLATKPQPKRSVAALAVSRDGKAVYALEHHGVVSLWSTQNGEHLEDWKVAPEALAAVRKQAKGMAVLDNMCLLPDGTVRVISLRGAAVYERGPRDKAFRSVLAFGEKFIQTLGSPTGVDVQRVGYEGDVAISSRWLAAARTSWLPGATPSDDEVLRMIVHVFDLDAGTEVHQITLRGEQGTASAFVGATHLVMATTHTSTESTGGDEAADGEDLSQIDVIDLANGARTTLDLRRGTQATGLVSYGDKVWVQVYEDNRWTYHLLDLAQLTLTPSEPVNDSPARFADGRIGLGEALCDREGNVLATYTLFDDHNVLTTSIDEVNGRLLIAGSNVPLPVLMVAPYDPDRAPARSAEPVATTALDWARPGAVLRYAIADFDADDEYTFEVLEAGANLRLRVSAGATEVASNLRFGAKALERAKRFVAIAQESLDVDASVLQDDRVPPFLLSRGSARTLRDGGELPLSTEWTDEETLEAHPALARVTIDGVEQTVSAYEASSGGSVRLTFLADPTWPLLVERVEGDCSVQLLGVDLSRAQGTGGVAVDGQPPPEGSAKKRRFELVEAGSGKFWEIELRGSGFSVRFGKLGTGGQTQHKSFDSNAAASREADKLVREKTKKGYREV